MNIKVDMFTTVGYSGVYCSDIEHAEKYVEREKNWYYCKITDADGKIVFEERRPYFVSKARILTDNYTGEKFWASQCFKTLEEARSANPIERVIVLEKWEDYLRLSYI